jgi:hypothetical protein
MVVTKSIAIAGQRNLAVVNATAWMANRNAVYDNY